MAKWLPSDFGKQFTILSIAGGFILYMIASVWGGSGSTVNLSALSQFSLYAQMIQIALAGTVVYLIYLTISKFGSGSLSRQEWFMLGIVIGTLYLGSKLLFQLGFLDFEFLSQSVIGLQSVGEGLQSVIIGG